MVSLADRRETQGLRPLNMLQCIKGMTLKPWVCAGLSWKAVTQQGRLIGGCLWHGRCIPVLMWITSMMLPREEGMGSYRGTGGPKALP